MSLAILDVASDAGVRAVLRALCADPDIRKKALGYLAKLEPQAASLATLDPSSLARMGLKRKAAGTSICVQCGDAFDEEDNRAKKCQYHAGEMEADMDSDYWADHHYDEVITAEVYGASHPEGFVWTCCNMPGDEDGCRFSRHVSDPRLNKKGRYDDDAASLSSWAEEPESDVEESEEEEEGSEQDGSEEEGSEDDDDSEA